MDAATVKAVLEWLKPDSSKQLQRFLGPFSWTPEAEKEFRDLRIRFSSARILCQPDPSRQFVVGVDASETWVPKPHALSRVFSQEESSVSQPDTMFQAVASFGRSFGGLRTSENLRNRWETKRHMS
ncbi:hypothetical protein DPEC_G00269210 [Dallia pectoralis]|uniref:Uncharacterized protein n=1 Tax=Dallia pectoralis TaxID=75939 RepID=A0ACC2FP06_DALPE|nr:hypothetical protein DPEC_G00269210 [Dallia pectoralis]